MGRCHGARTDYIRAVTSINTFAPFFDWELTGRLPTLGRRCTRHRRGTGKLGRAPHTGSDGSAARAPLPNRSVLSTAARASAVGANHGASYQNFDSGHLHSFPRLINSRQSALRKIASIPKLREIFHVHRSRIPRIRRAMHQVGHRGRDRGCRTRVHNSCRRLDIRGAVRRSARPAAPHIPPATHRPDRQSASPAVNHPPNPNWQVLLRFVVPYDKARAAGSRCRSVHVQPEILYSCAVMVILITLRRVDSTPREGRASEQKCRRSVRWLSTGRRRAPRS
jgi:hypothetical protein